MEIKEEYQYLLYGPRNDRSLLQQYPDLKNKPELRERSKGEIYFCWLMGIPGSPVDEEWPIDQRRKIAARMAFPNDEDKMKAFAFSNLSDEIQSAIRVFERMKPEARMLADRMTQRAFYNFQKMINVDVEKDFLITKKIKGPDGEMEEITETDHQSKKAYTDTVDKIMKSLPEMIDRIEKGYGIKEKKKDEEEERVIDIFHKNLQS